MKLGAFSFAPGIITTLAAAAFVALTVSLGRWQVHRAEEKRDRQALLEARLTEAPLRLAGPFASAEPLLYRRVRAAGRWIASGQIFVDNQVHEARAGFQVVTPLALEGRKDAVLVLRGWVERNRDYPRAPAVDVPAGDIEVEGIATVPPRRVLELGPETIAGNVWQNLSIDRYRAQTGIAALPVVILADTSPPGLAPVRERPDTGIEKHREYALTWFSLAALAAVLWVALNLKRTR